MTSNSHLSIKKKNTGYAKKQKSVPCNLKKKESLEIHWGGPDVGLRLSPSLPFSLFQFAGKSLVGPGVHPDPITWERCEGWGGQVEKICNIMAGRNYLLDPTWMRISSQRKEGSLIPIQAVLKNQWRHMENCKFVWAKTHLKGAGLKWKWLGALLQELGTDRKRDLFVEAKKGNHLLGCSLQPSWLFVMSCLYSSDFRTLKHLQA